MHEATLGDDGSPSTTTIRHRSLSPSFPWVPTSVATLKKKDKTRWDTFLKDAEANTYTTHTSVLYMKRILAS